MCVELFWDFSLEKPTNISDISTSTQKIISWFERFVQYDFYQRIFTARIRRMREGNIFSLLTLAGGGIPHSRSRQGVPHLADCGVPHSRSRMGGVGVLHPVLDRGYPIPGPDRGYPIPGLDEGYSILLMAHLQLLSC